MIQRLILKNFKAFSGRTVIPFGRLTLIFGRNSSGKSSIIQSLMFLRQSMSDIDRAGLTISQGALTNLGSGKQVLTGQDAGTECEITPIYDMASIRRNFPIPKTEGDARQGSVGAGYLFHLEPPNIELTVRERRYYADGHDHVASTEGGFLFSPVSVPENTVANPDATEVTELFAEFGDQLTRFYVENIEAWKLLILEALNLDDGRDLRDALLGAGEDFFLERSDDASFAGSGTITSWIEFLRFSSPNPGPGEEDSRHRTRLLRDLVGEVPECAADAAPILPALLRVHLETAFGVVRNRYAEMSIELFATELVAMRLDGSYRSGRRPSGRRSSAQWRNARQAANGFLPDFPTVVDQIRKRLPILDILPFVAQATNRATVNLRYIGPVRSQGLRFDEVRNLPDRDVGKDGRNAIQLIADDEGLRAQANAWMERLGIMYRMEPVRIETGRGAPILDARIIDARNNLELNLVDVGFGISQVAPVVVQSLLLASQTRGREEGRRHQRDTLLVEQPELHLHPAMQAELGSLFAEVVSASSTAQIIAETHSEALILRVMKLIRTGKLDASLVKVLWVDQDDDGHAFVRDLPIDASGEFEVSWPRGFFSERYAEMED